MRDEFDEFSIHLVEDEQGEYLAHLVELSNVSAYGSTTEEIPAAPTRKE